VMPRIRERVVMTRSWRSCYRHPVSGANPDASGASSSSTPPEGHSECLGVVEGLPVLEAVVWVWLALVLAFCGSLLLFGGALITPWRTNESWSPRRRPTSSPTWA
jgi:hypothetical protein